MSIYCNWRPVLAVYAELVVFCSVPVRHADGSSFMACLAVVQWDTGSLWPCPCSHTPFACSFALSWIMGAGVGEAYLETGTVLLQQQHLLARHMTGCSYLWPSFLVLAWNAQPQLFMESCDVGLFPASGYVRRR